jgi:PIN domain nuclease of toxin-antitoxin system
MRVLLDTVAFIFAVTSPELLSKRATTMLEEPETIAELSAISLSEIAIKCSLGKLDLKPEQVATGLSDFRAQVLPYTGAHAYQLFDLPLHHRDPFDRQIIAQAMAEDIPIVTSDKIFRRYRGLKVIW